MAAVFFEYSSLWAYLVEECGMEDSTAERRIRAARLLKRFPKLRDLLESISGMSCRAAKREIASRYPLAHDLPHDQVRPINEDFFEVRFAASQDLLDKLDEIRGLLAHSYPQMTMAELIDVLASDYRERHHPEAKAERARARDSNSSKAIVSPSTSGVIQAEKRSPSRATVHALTQSRGYVCSYIAPTTGKSRSSRYGLQIDHVQPWALGGPTELSNLRYLCRSHHRRITFLEFGDPPKLPNSRTCERSKRSQG